MNPEPPLRRDALQQEQTDRLVLVFELHMRHRSPALAAAASTAAQMLGEPTVLIVIKAILALADQGDTADAIGRFDALRQATCKVPGGDADLAGALMAALADGLGAAFAGACRQAWVDGYIRLVETVMAGRRSRFDFVA